MRIRSATGLALTLSACNALFGVDGLSFDPRGAGGTAGASAGGGGATGTDAGGVGGDSTGFGGGGGQAGGGGGGGGPVVELCTNGDDDDGDGDVDCADADCAGYTCVSIPEGWEGVAELRLGAAAKQPCPTDLVATDGGVGPSVPPPSCNACTCAPATGMTCDSPTVSTYKNKQCSNQGTSYTLGVGCMNIVAFDVESVRGVGVAAMGGSCTPGGGGVAQLGPLGFYSDARLCGTAGGACATGSCVPQVLADVPCIFKAGDHACPLALAKTLVYTGGFGEDKRGCTACSCAAPGGGTCSATSEVHSGAGCSQKLASIAHDDGCKDTLLANGNASLKRVSVSFDSGSGTCTSAGGKPTGVDATKPVDPVTVCCKPSSGP